MISWTTPITNIYFRSQVRMTWLSADFSTRTSETIVHTTTPGSHELPGVAATGNNTFVVAWQGYGAHDPTGIYSRLTTDVVTLQLTTDVVK